MLRAKELPRRFKMERPITDAVYSVMIRELKPE
jgi:hypothetical protein